MTLAEARAILQEAGCDEMPVVLPPGALAELIVADLPDGVRVEVGTTEDGVHYSMDWGGRLLRRGERVRDDGWCQFWCQFGLGIGAFWGAALQR